MAIVFLNGRYLDERKAHLSIHDAGFLYGEGVYETLRTRQGKIENSEAHLNRLARSASIVGIKMPARSVLCKALQGVATKNGFWRERGLEARIRLTLSGGIHDFDVDSVSPTVLITAVPLPEIARARSGGVYAISFHAERFIPHIKTTHLLPSLLARRAMHKANAYEVLLVNNRGYVTEGSITNFFWIKRWKLYTPKSNLLHGTTRDIIFKLARKFKIPVERHDVRLATLYNADELFICNAPRGIIPVVKLDERKIGDGRAGEVTRQLMTHF